MTKYKTFFYLLIFLILFFVGYKIYNNIYLKIFEKKHTGIMNDNEKNFNFTKTIIKISLIFESAPEPQWVENQIYYMADNLKQRIGQEANPEYIINKFNDYFFNIENFSYDENFNNTQKLTYSQLITYNSIQNALKNKKSICMTISLIYLMLGDILNLPLYGVLIPGHIYVRYREEGKSGINIETTYKGYEYYGYYIVMPGTDGNDKSSYGKELSKYQVIGAYLNNLGSSLLSIGELQKAEILLKKSLQFLSDISEPYINLGILYEKFKKPEIALKYYMNAIEINPQSDFILTKIGVIFYNQSRFIKAQEYLEKAIKINKENKEALDLITKIKEKN